MRNRKELRTVFIFHVLGTEQEEGHFFFFLFRAAPVAYGGSQARGQVGAIAFGLHYSHGNVGSKLYLQTTPQLMVTVNP